MLEIHGEDFALLVKKAIKTQSSDSFLRRLSFMNDRAHVCKLYCSGGREAEFVIYNKEGERLFNGGLVYHEFDNSWGTHT